MGAWGCGSFENDDALDWVYRLEESRDFSVVEDAFDTVISQATDYVEAPDCCCALAAAEVVAAVRGHPLPDLPEEVDEWVRTQREVNGKLVEKARRAVHVVLEESELKDLFDESGHSGEWSACVRDLIERLGG